MPRQVIYSILYSIYITVSRLDNPPGSAGVAQLSATPRHVLCVTDTGECWTHEEGKVGMAALCTVDNIKIRIGMEESTGHC